MALDGRSAFIVRGRGQRFDGIIFQKSEIFQKAPKYVSAFIHCDKEVYVSRIVAPPLEGWRLCVVWSWSSQGRKSQLCSTDD